jgi:hypothetical protein
MGELATRLGGLAAALGPIGEGVFTSGPAATSSLDGSRVHLMARGTDRDLWHNWATPFLEFFQPHWKALSSGSFVSAPAMATDATGANVYVAAFGDDFTIYTNHSASEAGPWDGAHQVGPDPGLFI